MSFDPAAVVLPLAWLQSANMHGNEPSGRFLLPLLAEWLCSNQADARASRIINNMHLVSSSLTVVSTGSLPNENTTI